MRSGKPLSPQDSKKFEEILSHPTQLTDNDIQLITSANIEKIKANLNTKPLTDQDIKKFEKILNNDEEMSKILLPNDRDDQCIKNTVRTPGILKKHIRNQIKKVKSAISHDLPYEEYIVNILSAFLKLEDAVKIAKGNKTALEKLKKITLPVNKSPSKTAEKRLISGYITDTKEAIIALEKVKKQKGKLTEEEETTLKKLNEELESLKKELESLKLEDKIARYEIEITEFEEKKKQGRFWQEEKLEGLKKTLESLKLKVEIDKLTAKITRLENKKQGSIPIEIENAKTTLKKLEKEVESLNPNKTPIRRHRLFPGKQAKPNEKQNPVRTSLLSR